MNDTAQDDRRRRHAARMFSWEKQVAKDPAAGRQATAIRAVPLIRDKVNQQTGRASFDQKWLAGQLKVSPRGVQKALAWMVARGHLVVHCGKERGTSSEYEPVSQEVVRPPVRTPHREDERRFAPGTNATTSNLRTPVRTSIHQASSKPSGGGRAQMVDRGKAEAELAARLGLGYDWEAFERMPEGEFGELCRRQAAGQVSDRDIDQLKLRLFSAVGSTAAAETPDCRPDEPAASVAKYPDGSLPRTPAAMRHVTLLQKWGAPPAQACRLYERLLDAAGPARRDAVDELFVMIERRHNLAGKRRLEWLRGKVATLARYDFYRPQRRPPSPLRRKNRDAVLGVLRKAPAGRASIAEIAAHIGRPIGAVRNLAARLIADGEIVRVRPGVFGLARDSEAPGAYEPAAAAVLRLLAAAPSMTTAEMITAAGKTRSAIDAALFRLVADGAVLRVGRGVFSLASARRRRRGSP